MSLHVSSGLEETIHCNHSCWSPTSHPSILENKHFNYFLSCCRTEVEKAFWQLTVEDPPEVNGQRGTAGFDSGYDRLHPAQFLSLLGEGSAGAGIIHNRDEQRLLPHPTLSSRDGACAIAKRISGTHLAHLLADMNTDVGTVMSLVSMEISATSIIMQHNLNFSEHSLITHLICVFLSFKSKTNKRKSCDEKAFPRRMVIFLWLPQLSKTKIQYRYHPFWSIP